MPLMPDPGCWILGIRQITPPDICTWILSTIRHSIISAVWYSSFTPGANRDNISSVTFADKITPKTRGPGWKQYQPSTISRDKRFEYKVYFLREIHAVHAYLWTFLWLLKGPAKLKNRRVPFLKKVSLPCATWWKGTTLHRPKTPGAKRSSLILK